MTRNEKLRRVDIETTGYAAVVVAWIATDVLDENFSLFTLKAQDARIEPQQIATIAIAANGAKGLETGQSLGQLHRADITRVPYFIALGKVLRIAVVPITVGV